MIRYFMAMSCVGAAVLISGCASDNPNEGGFFGGLVGLGSGAYGERVAAEKAALEAEEVRYQNEVGGRDELDQTLERRRVRAEDLEEQAAFLKREMADLDTEIAALQENEDVTQEQVIKAEADIAVILGDIDQIEAEQAAHERARALGADADQDADPAEFGEPPREQVSDLRAYIDKLQDAVDALKSTREKRASEASASDAD